MLLFQELEKRRKELGMSRLALARRSRVSLPTINRILSDKQDGNGQLPKGGRASFANVAAVADALGLTLTAPEKATSDEFCQQEARRKAKRVVGMVQGTSGLEGQGLDQQEMESLVVKATKRILKSKRKLWF